MAYEGKIYSRSRKMLDSMTQVESLIDISQLPVDKQEATIKIKWENNSWHIVSLQTTDKVFEYKNGNWERFI